MKAYFCRIAPDIQKYGWRGFFYIMRMNDGRIREFGIYITWMRKSPLLFDRKGVGFMTWEESVRIHMMIKVWDL